MAERTAGAPYFRQFAEFARAGRSPLYERLSLEIAKDPDVLAFAGLAREGQPQANVLFGAVHALLLGGAKDPLAAYYPSCGGTRAAGDGDVYAAFQDFVVRNRAALEPMVRSRITNTNEVARAALTYPAFDFIARETKAPLQIVEIGPSAGLNLNWHRYGYRYTDEAGKPIIERGGEREFVLTAELRGAKRPALAAELPEVRHTRGLEQSPVDLTSRDERLWLRALIWPERLDRLARLDAAIDIAIRYPPPITAGDAVRDLAATLATFDARLPVTIVHTLVIYQWGKTALAAFESLLGELSGGREIFRVFIEWDHQDAGYPLGLARYAKGECMETVLARCDSHGGWLEWLL
jgi:hypothetical protein